MNNNQPVNKMNEGHLCEWRSKILSERKRLGYKKAEVYDDVINFILKCPLTIRSIKLEGFKK